MAVEHTGAARRSNARWFPILALVFVVVVLRGIGCILRKAEHRTPAKDQPNV